MVGVGSLVEIGHMAALAGIGCIIVIPVMTGGTVIGYDGMRAIQYIIIIVIREIGRTPTGCSRVAGHTIRREI